MSAVYLLPTDVKNCCLYVANTFVYMFLFKPHKAATLWKIKETIDIL